MQKFAPTFAATRPEDVFGALSYGEKLKSIVRTDTAILADAKLRHIRD